MNQQFTDIIDNSLDPILGEFTSININIFKHYKFSSGSGHLMLQKLKISTKTEQTSNIQQLQEILNKLIQENLQYEEEIILEFYDPKQYTIKQQKKELLELYDLNDQLLNKLTKQESINNQQQDTIKRQNSLLNSQKDYRTKITNSKSEISNIRSPKMRE
ncbi:unnamed protein product [Paramecium sonneborni]|uniref:Uncharacterized protein n=1 Tax=Paramecium sonneborni TaxID=65129 RepID=A0A8S1NK90_9CILI|nr:unnamed protein product [Paramecium sonneborni]